MLSVCAAVTERINELLKQKNLSLYKLAMNSGVWYDTLKKITKNNNKSVDFALVIKIAGGFDMSVDEFVKSPLFAEENLNI
jgi:transcriptional regulator with XRE-family HTH domain